MFLSYSLSYRLLAPPEVLQTSSYLQFTLTVKMPQTDIEQLRRLIDHAHKCLADAENFRTLDEHDALCVAVILASHRLFVTRFTGQLANAIRALSGDEQRICAVAQSQIAHEAVVEQMSKYRQRLRS
jgi:hypothetical protein